MARRLQQDASLTLQQKDVKQQGEGTRCGKHQAGSQQLTALLLTHRVGEVLFCCITSRAQLLAVGPRSCAHVTECQRGKKVTSLEREH